MSKFQFLYRIHCESIANGSLRVPVIRTSSSSWTIGLCGTHGCETTGKRYILTRSLRSFPSSSGLLFNPNGKVRYARGGNANPEQAAVIDYGEQAPGHLWATDSECKTRRSAKAETPPGPQLHQRASTTTTVDAVPCGTPNQTEMQTNMLEEVHNYTERTRTIESDVRCTKYLSSIETRRRLSGRTVPPFLTHVRG